MISLFVLFVSDQAVKCQRISVRSPKKLARAIAQFNHFAIRCQPGFRLSVREDSLAATSAIGPGKGPDFGKSEWKLHSGKMSVRLGLNVQEKSLPTLQPG
jgi:hypothetical protein